MADHSIASRAGANNEDREFREVENESTDSENAQSSNEEQEINSDDDADSDAESLDLGDMIDDFGFDSADDENVTTVRIVESDPPIEPEMYHLQRILGNPEPDAVFVYSRHPLPASLIDFNKVKVPLHAQKAVIEYFKWAVPTSLNEHLAGVLTTIPDDVQAELATFMTEINNVVAVADRRTVLHVWSVFRQSEALTQWLGTLTTEILQPVLGTPLTGQELLAMLPSVRTAFGHSEGSATLEYHHVGKHSHDIPQELPTPIKHLVNRLPEDCHGDVVNLITGLPPNDLDNVAQVLRVAPAGVLKCIVDTITKIGAYDIDILTAGKRGTFKLAENFDGVAAVKEWLSSGQDVPQLIVDRQAIIQKLRYGQVIISQKVSTTSRLLTPNAVSQSGLFRLEIGKAPEFNLGSMAGVRSFTGSLKVVQIKDLAEEEQTCYICSQKYQYGTGKQLRLQCGHVFDADCLHIILGPKAEGGWGHDACPSCNKKVQ